MISFKAKFTTDSNGLKEHAYSGKIAIPPGKIRRFKMTL